MKKWMAVFAALMMFTSIFCSCAKEEKDGKVEIHCFDFAQYDGLAKDPIMQKIYDETGVDFNFAGAMGQAAYDKQLKIKVNIGEAPDVFFMATGTDMSQVNLWAKQGAILPLDEYFGDYPNLKKIFETDQFKNLKVNGNHYFIPRLTTASNWAMYCRQDWITNLQNDEDGAYKDVKMPATDGSFTLEDFAYLMEAFTLGDPDMNGVNDTYGFTLGTEIFWGLPIYNAFGVQPDWALVEGEEELKYQYETEEFYNYLLYMRKLFADGYLDPTFNENTDTLKRSKFQEGKCGLLIDNGSDFIPYILQNAIFGADDVMMVAPPVGTVNTGKQGVGGFTNFGGWWGGFFISSNCKNVEGALKLFDYIFSEEGSKLISYGIEGIHYTVGENGDIVPDLENRGKEKQGLFIEYKNADGKNERTGNIAWGSYFTLPISKVTQEAVYVQENYSGYLEGYRLLAEDSAKILENNLISNPLTNFTSWTSDFSENTSKVQNYANIYAVCIIANASYEGVSDPAALWDRYLSQTEVYREACHSEGIRILKEYKII